MSLLKFKYHVGRYLAGQSVELVCHDGLIEIFHDSVLVATHARRHLPEQHELVQRQVIAAALTRPATDQVVILKVDRNGSVSFAGADYRVGMPAKIARSRSPWQATRCRSRATGGIVRTHAVKHDRRKEHRAFANPGGRPFPSRRRLADRLGPGGARAVYNRAWRDGEGRATVRGTLEGAARPSYSTGSPSITVPFGRGR